MAALARTGLRIVVVGGGPGGLLFALLAKARHPQHDIVVLERNPPGATFGFGVVFSERTLGGFASADPQLHAAMTAAGVDWTDIEVRLREQRLRCGGHGFSAIARKTLLTVMQERAREIGVELRFEHEATESDLEGADLVLAADGANSTVRRWREDAFRPAFETGAAKYIWFATPQPFDALTFIFAEDQHGHWGVHAYPFEDGTSTFIVETDEATWRRAGLDKAGDLPPGQSDMTSLRFVEQLFAEHLGGHGLLENNSKWLNFRTLRCGTWHDGNVALAGDAAHTAHFSVGSGTKMAMEDAVALVDAVEAAGSVAEALECYESVRRPHVEYVQAAAVPSLIWWERFRHLADRSLEQFSFHFLSRSPMVTRERLVARDGRFVRRVDRWAAEAIGDGAERGPLSATLEVAGLRLPSRLISAAEPGADPLVALGGAALGGAGLVLATSDLNTDWAPVVDWLHEHTEAAVGLWLAPEDPPQEAERAAAAGFDTIASPLEAITHAGWPAERLLLAMVQAPADVEGEPGDALVGRLRAAARGRSVIAAVAGADDTEATRVQQLLLCDRIKQETGLPCALVDATPTDDAAVTAVLAGRVDLVQGSPSLVSPYWERRGVAVVRSAVGQA